MYSEFTRYRSTNKDLEIATITEPVPESLLE